MLGLTEELLIGALVYFVPDGSIIGATKATGTLTLAADIVADETVTIGGVTYTFKAAAGETANQVKVGANRSESLDNLIAAINLSAGAGNLYGSETVVHPTVSAAAGALDTMVVTALAGGTNGNAIATTESLAGVGNQWGAATLAGGISGDAVTIDSKPALDADWKEFEFGCISRVKRVPTKKTEERECSRGAQGGYGVKLREWVVRDTTEFQTLEYNEIFWRLAYGLDGPVTRGVEQSINKRAFRELDGWTRIVAFREDGSKLCTEEHWDRLRLGDVPEWKNESGAPIYQLEYLSSGEADLDTVLFS